MSLVLAIAAAAAEPLGLSLREAQTLPAPAVVERVLGAVGVLYPEVGRPSSSITRGSGFQITFASTPRATLYPGVCEADMIAVNFGPAADSLPTVTVQVESVNRGRVYRIISDTAAPVGGWHESDQRRLNAQCAAARPVLSAPGQALRFFSGTYSATGEFWAAHAYFGARALATASSSTTPRARCRDDLADPGDRVCDNAAALLRNPPMERLVGFQIDRCREDASNLCVTANFSRGPSLNRRFIAIRMRTSLSEVTYPMPEFALRDIEIYASAIVD